MSALALHGCCFFVLFCFFVWIQADEVGKGRTQFADALTNAFFWGFCNWMLGIPFILAAHALLFAS